MKESRLLIYIFLLLMALLIPLYFLLIYLGTDYDFSMSICSNLFCGFVVGIVTSICQYTIQKREIINNVYTYYYDLYMTFFILEKKPMLNHYFCMQYYKKLIELQPKISEQIGNYYGIFKRHDRVYKKLNPNIDIVEEFKYKKIKRSIYKLNNKKDFYNCVGTINSNVREILIGINAKKFSADEKSRIKIYNYLLN